MILAHKLAILSYMKSLRLSQPHVIAVVGIPGSGKTFFAEKFADTFHAPYVSAQKVSDCGVDDPRVVSEITDQQIDQLLKTKQSIIVEVPAETRTARTELARKVRKAGFETLYVWVQTDLATSKSRSLKANKNLTSEDYDRQHKRFKPLTESEKPLVISGKHTYATQAKVVLTKLSAPRAEITGHEVAPIQRQQSNRRNIAIR